MNIVVTAPTGNVGARLTEHLLGAGEAVTLLARQPGKVSHYAARGARVEQGDLSDTRFVTEATRGADALFWLTPPDLAKPDLRAYQNRLGQIAAGAVRANGIPRVVNLSSTGAHQSHGTGPVKGLHDVEHALDATGASVVHLRPTFFMENLFLSLDGIREAGAVFLPVPGPTRVPMVATRDIAAAAARLLRDATWSGRRVLHLWGPQDHTFDETAAILASALGRPVAHVAVTPAQMVAALTGRGLSAHIAEQYAELYGALESGHLLAGLTAEPELRGETTLAQFAADTLRPALAG